MEQTTSQATPTQSKQDLRPADIYPTLVIDRIQNPNRLFAIPLLGILIKIIVLIPQSIMLIFLEIALFFVWIINSFIVLFTGKYWDTAYTFNLSFMRFLAKIYLYLFGFTDKYPGFDFEIHDNFSIDIPKPENPNRLYAVPILGFFIRSVLLIPYYIYASVMFYGAVFGVIISSFVVLFTGKYPESTFEFGRDTQRIYFSILSYIFGFSEKYPSWHISMNHKPIKIGLIVVGILLTITNMFNRNHSSSFKAGFSSSFVATCEKNGSSASYCVCVAEYMTNNYTDLQLIQMTTQKSNTGQTPQPLKDGANYCTAKQSQPANQYNSPNTSTY